MNFKKIGFEKAKKERMKEMKQTSKKVLSLLMALTMLIGMMTAVSVSAAEEAVEFEVTVKVGKGGTATCGDDTLSGSKKTYAVEPGTDMILTVAPESGKYADVRVADPADKGTLDGMNGTKIPVVNNQAVLENVSADSEIRVVFTDIGWEYLLYADFDAMGGLHNTANIIRNDFDTTTKSSEYVTDSETGSKVYKTTMTANKTSSTQLVMLQGVTYETGATYRLSMDAKASRNKDADGKHIGLFGVHLGSNKNLMIVDDVAKELTTEWQPIGCEYTTSAGASGLELRQRYKPANGENILKDDTIYLDNIVIEKKIATNTIAVETGEGGSVTYNGAPVSAPITVNSGSAVTLTAVPAEGYSISEITVGGEAVAHDNGVFSVTADADKTVYVTFVQTVSTTYNVTVDADAEGGRVTYNEAPVTEPISVEEGEDLTLTVVANEGYTATVMQGETELEIVEDTVTVENVTEDTTITVTFTKITNDVTVIVGEGGKVMNGEDEVTEAISVEYGESVELTIVPDNGYDIGTVTVGGETVVPVEGVITVSNVTAATAVNVTFVKQKRTVTLEINTPEGGKVFCGEEQASESMTVEYGDTVTFRVVPGSNFNVEVSQNDSPLDLNAQNEVSFVVTENSVVKVTFTEKPPVYAGITTVTPNFSAKHGDRLAIFVYSKLNSFTVGENLNYGIKLWNTAKPDAVVTLEARDIDGNIAVATPDAPFAIRVFGKAIKAGQTYGIQPFVGEEVGAVETGTVTEKTGTVTE